MYLYLYLHHMHTRAHRERKRLLGWFTEGLAYMSVGAQKPHSLPSASWSSGRAGDVSHSKSESPRTRISDKHAAQDEREREFALLLLFCSIWTLTGLNNASPKGWGQIFTQSSDSNVILFQKHTHRPTETVFDQLSGHPCTPSGWHITIPNGKQGENGYEE